MYRMSFLFLFACLLLSGCIAGGGKPYDDRASVYEPTITLNETIIDDARYTLVAENIVTKFHEDVGNITEVTFQFTNHTDEDVYLTASLIKFDDVTVDEHVMTFFESMPSNSSGSVVAYFQDIRENNWTFNPPIRSVYMELDVVDSEKSESIALYPMDVTF